MARDIYETPHKKKTKNSMKNKETKPTNRVNYPPYETLV